MEILYFLILFFTFCNSNPLPDRVYIRNETTSNHNQTVSDLMQHQTDTIKKIVSNHQIDYPILTKPKQTDQIPIDELKVKCQHLARLLSSTTPTPPPRNFTPSGFYITEETSSTTPKSTQTPIKYIKLEPVILQKTIMTDGKIIYYWHKSIPSQFGPAPISTTPPTSTTTTTIPSGGYNFRNFFPSFYSIGSAESISQTTTEKTTTTEKYDDLHLYQQQLKFVVPVPYVPADGAGVKKPWEIDQYAYYPKPLQPENVNVQVPYVPTFHVIKALAVPNPDVAPAADAP